MATLRATWLANQAKEAQRLETMKDTNKRLAEEQRCYAGMRNEERAENKRMIRMMQMRSQEEAMQEKLKRTAEDRELKSRRREQEERLAQELERIRDEATRDEKMRQQIRGNSTELRELEAKLREAYVAKERKAQMAEKRALEYDRLHEDADLVRAMKEEAERAARIEQEHEENKASSKIRYQAELERQLEEREVQRQQAYEEFLKDKLMIDEIVRKIYEEDQRERERDLEKRKATQVYISEFQAERAQWKAAERDRMEEENRRILAFMAEQQQREGVQLALKKEREEAKERVQGVLAEQIAAKERERREIEDIRQELVLEEEEEKARHYERDEMEKKIRQRVELQGEFAKQRAYRQAVVAAEKAEEEKYKQAMLTKFAEDDRLEQMNAQKRRMKQLEHKRAVEELLADRRTRFDAERAALLEEEAEAKRLEEFRRKVIEEERQRILQEHAHKLLGYLPRGVILSAKDLQMLGTEFQEEYRKREVDMSDESFWDDKLKRRK